MNSFNSLEWKNGGSGSYSGEFGDAFNPPSLNFDFPENSLEYDDLEEEGEVDEDVVMGAVIDRTVAEGCPASPTPVFDSFLQQQQGGCSELLNNIYRFSLAQHQNFPRVRAAQRAIFASAPDPGNLQLLMQQLHAMEKDTRDALNVLDRIWSSSLLTPLEVTRVVFLKKAMQVQLEALVLYISELMMSTGQPVENPNLTSLVIIDQPFPAPTTKGKPADSPLSVQVLTGASVQVVHADVVRVSPVKISSGKGKLPKGLVGDVSAPLDPLTKLVHFEDLTFSTGTRKNPVCLQCSVDVVLHRNDGQQASVTLTSQLTNPFVSCSNEVQWTEAEGILMGLMLFKEKPSVPWFSVANTMQLRLIPSTRQDVESLQRILSPVELNYFHARWFNNEPEVSHAAFKAFWSWYGKCIHRIRYTKHVLPLYLCGRVFGFIAKNEMEVKLLQHPAGTFMIRFSESNPGEFAIAYKARDPANPMVESVRHYIVSDQDVTAKRSIAEFLGDAPTLIHLLVYNPQSGWGTALEFERMEKHAALSKYYPKRRGKETKIVRAGYDPALVPQQPIHVPMQPPPALSGDLVIDDYSVSNYWDAE